jgi:hypothetical protein
MSMSVDGFIADPDDDCADLFGWYGNGDVEVPTADSRWTFRVSPASAPVLRGVLTRAAVRPEIVAGTEVTHLRYQVLGRWKAKASGRCTVHLRPKAFAGLVRAKPG